MEHEWHDSYSQCAACGKKYYGYDDLNGVEVNGTFYCEYCCPSIYTDTEYGRAVRPDMICAMTNRSAMYDGPNQFYTDMAEFKKHYFDRKAVEIKVKKQPDTIPYSDCHNKRMCEDNIERDCYYIYIWYDYEGTYKDGQEQRGWYWMGQTYELRDDIRPYLEEEE